MSKTAHPTPALIKIGKVAEPRALKGELKIYLFSGEASWLKKVTSLQFIKDDKKILFKITSKAVKDKQLVVKLAGINDRTEAEKWLGAEVFIEEKNFQSKPGEEIFLREILGFKVMNENEEVGVITSFESNMSQDILVVNEKILIPLVKEFLVKIDNKNKIVVMKLPPGLLEVNL